MATKSSILHPPNETKHTISRITREGKKISYTLNVIQQPERARACGAGARSSADRRPVDPPPVVELRIFESDANDLHKTDITFGYNANFFLFATLEWARPMAHGRIQGQPSCPVLTGVPVAGIAYLDRPSQAGYFIFPDLSVRHEGLYRLNFNLYEEMKDVKDMDRNAAIPIQENLVPAPSKPRTPDHFLHFRLEVKSAPFTVFSAKKFPGLSESTNLSRVVAEQGCRVRIRRDVRMRRREPKVNKDYGYDSRHMTPDVYPGTPIERPRSVSNASIDDQFRYTPTQHHPADYGYNHHFPQHAPIPIQGPPTTPAGQSHLSFGSLQPQYQAPLLPSQHPASSATYPSPRPDYPYTRRASAGSENNSRGLKLRDLLHSPQVPVDGIEQPKTGLPTVSMDTSGYQSSDGRAYQSAAQSLDSAPPSNTAADNLQPAVAKPPVIAVDPDIESLSPINSGLPSPTCDAAHGKGWSYPTDPIHSKRPHEDAFGVAPQGQPLHDGKRPDAVSEQETEPQDLETQGSKVSDDLEYQDAEANCPMIYRRANGSISTRFGNSRQD